MLDCLISPVPLVACLYYSYPSHSTCPHLLLTLLVLHLLVLHLLLYVARPPVRLIARTAVSLIARTAVSLIARTAVSLIAHVLFNLLYRAGTEQAKMLTCVKHLITLRIQTIRESATTMHSLSLLYLTQKHATTDGS